MGNEWKLEKKGLHKQVLNIDLRSFEKPSEISKVQFILEEVQGLNERVCDHLADNKLNQEQEMEMGHARTPVGIYVECLLQQMLPGETSRCTIKTKDGKNITFILTLQRILESKDLYTLSVLEMYKLAQQYKENGVVMFKEYPKFAHEYFARAAKFLISYKPFDHLTKANDGVDAEDMESLFFQIQTNLAACLLQQERYEHVIYHTQFVESTSSPSEKSIYRRAIAFYNMKEFESALKIMEKVSNYSENRDFAKLHARIMESWKASNDQYKTVVQRMFS